MIFFIFGLLLLTTIVTRLTVFVNSGDYDSALFQGVRDFFVYEFFPFFKFISLAVSGFSIVGIAYSLIKLTELNKKINSALGAPTETRDVVTEDLTEKSTKWDRVMAHMATDNPSEWRLAIIEADIILEEFLNMAGYRGETVSEKLKKVEKSDFETIEAAWEAHKVRNQVAHDGADFILTREKADRAIALYRAVFEEFKYI
jgi:hypothetical protein